MARVSLKFKINGTIFSRSVAERRHCQCGLWERFAAAPKKNMKKKAEKFLSKDHTDSNMLVAIRIRPLNSKEKQNQDSDIIRTEDKLLIVLDKVELECETEGKKPEMLHRSREQRYYFDRIFPQGSTTETVYMNTCQDLIYSVVQGYNACVFAYGTTGSGKTYTMAGTQENPGIMYLIIKGMFEKIQDESEKKIELKVSYVEIYNEVIRDLLVSNSKDTVLELRDEPDKGVQLAGVTEFEVQEPHQIMSLLQIGNKRRTTEATNANQTSSRSHAIFQIQLSTKDKLSNTEAEVLCGKLSLIDLAGSERGTATENRGIRLREGAKINTSLLALANCINALGDKTKKGFFVPFRDSKLTRMLKDSLGGNCKTVMIATISPASNQNEETINTLKYANRAKNIKMRVEPNKKMVYMHISAYKSIIADLRDEIDKLKLQLSSDIVRKGSSVITKTSSDIMHLQNQGDIDERNSLQLQQQQIIEQQKEQISKMGRAAILNEECRCDSRKRDELEKRIIMTDIAQAYEEIIQLEQALIELDEQNTLNALEIRKREAKVFILQRQLEEIEDDLKQQKENLDEALALEAGVNPSNEVAFLERHIQQHSQQIEILSESTKQNLLKRQSMKNELYENYQEIKNLRMSIDQRIENRDVKDYLELVIKNNFLESQNVQLLLNLQLQARTIMDLKNMITKQQKYIEDNDIGGSANGDLFLDGGDLDFEDQDVLEDQYISDFQEEKGNTALSSQLEGPSKVEQLSAQGKQLIPPQQKKQMTQPTNIAKKQATGSSQQYPQKQVQAQQPTGSGVGSLSVVGSGVQKNAPQILGGKASAISSKKKY